MKKAKWMPSVALGVKKLPIKKFIMTKYFDFNSSKDIFEYLDEKNPRKDEQFYFDLEITPDDK